MKRFFPALVLLLGGCRSFSLPAGKYPARRSRYPFVDATQRAGIHFQQHSGASQALNIYQISAGGCGILDYDGDGRMDLYFVQGKHSPGPDGGNQLYRNRGDGTFEDVTQQAGVSGHGYGMACASGDFEGEGRPDLYVCNYGRNELFRNRGDGTFAEVGAASHADVSGFSVGAVSADLDGDGWPDLYVVRYVSLTPRSRMICDEHGVPDSCGPQMYAPQPGVFLHNRGGGVFEDRTRAAGLVDPGRGMAATIADLNDDGHLDLFVTNDTTANALFRQKSPGRFTDSALAAGVAYGDLGVAEANMGCDSGDYSGSGRLGLFVGVMQDRMSLLFRNEGNDTFTLVSREAGLAEATSPVVTFGCGFFDYNNDGALDIFQANGHVHNFVERVNPRQRYAQPRQLLENVNGSFIDRTASAGPAFTTPAVGRGAAFGDLNNDGTIDVVVNNLDGRPVLLINQAQRALHRHWLEVSLVGRVPNTCPEGARLELPVGRKRLLRTLHRGYSYASTNDPRVHFGLGEASAVGPLEIRWPDGTQQQAAVPAVDRLIVVREETP